ncbi:hypothetical protein ES703_20658 [subsurface metagenome]
MTEKEYRKIIWGLLKDYRDDEKITLVELLNKIMAIGIPEEKKGKVTVNKKDKSEVKKID